VRRALRRTVANLVLVVVGFLIMAYPLTVGASAPISCRGVIMQPGDVCPKADGSAVQSYEQRAQARRTAVPVVLVIGLLVAGFGGTLLIMDHRAAQRSKTAVS
jgi:hypothetical protein